jgi:hypothetical protein
MQRDGDNADRPGEHDPCGQDRRRAAARRAAELEPQRRSSSESNDERPDDNRDQEQSPVVDAHRVRLAVGRYAGEGKRDAGDHDGRAGADCQREQRFEPSPVEREPDS